MFIRFVLGVVVTTYLLYQLPSFPTFQIWTAVLLTGLGVSISALFQYQAWRARPVLQQLLAILSGAIIGAVLVFWQSFFVVHIPPQYLESTVQIKGRVLGLPQVVGISSTDIQLRRKIKFDFEVESIGKVNDFSSMHDYSWIEPKVRLTWVLPADVATEIPKPGQIWSFRAKLKPNHGNFNPGGFDYETYLFQAGIAATGYIVNDGQGGLALKQQDGLLPQPRLALASHLQEFWKQAQFKGLYEALVYGQTQDISADEWLLLQNTGTIHLVAISGLHLSILAALGFWLFGGIWRLFILKHAWIPWQGIRNKLLLSQRHVWASCGALVFATIYLALAGFSIPTQRAWLMVVAVLIFVIINRKFQPISALALAAILIVLWQPTSVLSPGFWLSFVAVGLIFGALFHPFSKTLPPWKKFWLVQIVLFIGLAPLIAFYYQQIPLVSLIANFVAVPFISFIGLPGVFLTVLLSFISADLASVLLVLMDWAWHQLWWFLAWLAQWDSNQIPMSVELWQLVIWYSVLWSVWHLNLKDNRQKRIAWLLFLVTLVTLTQSFWKQPLDGMRMTVLDVGQGQSIVLETEHHTVVIDTGPYWGERLNGSTMAVLPYLKSRHRKAIDLLVVSHGDQDHAGGTTSLVKALSVKEAISGQPLALNQSVNTSIFKLCQNGQKWQFDEMTLMVIAPESVSEDWPEAKNDNDFSCVVKVSYRTLKDEKNIYIMGDLSQGYEKRLAKHYQGLLGQETEVLVAGHHGSKTATTSAWLEAIQPKWVMFSSGYHNRFGFPNTQVLERVQAQDSKWLNTACSGAIQFSISRSERRVIAESYRLEHAKWYHHRCLLTEQGRFYQ